MHLSSNISLLLLKFAIFDFESKYLLGNSFREINLFQFTLDKTSYLSLSIIDLLYLTEQAKSSHYLLSIEDFLLVLFNRSYINPSRHIYRMDTLRPYLHECREHLHTGIRTTEELFIYYIEYVDFPLFCVIYSIFLLWLLKKLNRPAIFRPQNKEITTWKQSLKKKVTTFIVSLPGIKQYVARKLEKGLAELEGQMIADFQKNRDPLKSKKLPLQGMKTTNIESRINKWFDIEKKLMFTGKNSGSIYPQSNDFCQEVSDFAAKYMYHNPLHLDTYKEVGKMQAELLKMTANIISKNKAYGVITSGGSESLIMSLYAYRKYYNKPRPNIVVPQSIHAALDKGAMYFNIEVRKARLNQNYEVDLNDMQSLIDSNTIALYASYPNYPHGIIDPVVEVGKMARKHKIAFHIDGCLGGLVAGFLKDHESRFTLDIEGATSISLDHHKFGLAPKGISTVFFKTKELRQQMYFIYTDWVGAVYITPSFSGSRSGFASAGAWYCFTHIGRKTYLENALAVVDATKTAAKQLRQIEGVKVLAFYSETIDCFSLSSALNQRSGWKVPGQHLPECIHVSVTISNYHQVKHSLAKDVRAAIEFLKSEPPKQTSLAALYGASSALPSQDLGDEMIKTIMCTTFK